MLVEQRPIADHLCGADRQRRRIDELAQVRDAAGPDRDPGDLRQVRGDPVVSSPSGSATHRCGCAGDPTVLRAYHQHGRLLDAGTIEQIEASATAPGSPTPLAGERSLLLVDSSCNADHSDGDIYRGPHPGVVGSHDR